jgi:hypothetical protein
MELTYRFRYLLYFVAFVLVMSVCFVYAEPLPQSHLLLQGSPQHASFLAQAAAEPSFDPAALHTAVTPVVSPQLLQQLITEARTRHSVPHRGRPLALHFATLPGGNASSAMPATEGLARP